MVKDVYKYNDFLVCVVFYVGIVDEFENLGDIIEFYLLFFGFYNFFEYFLLEVEIGYIFNGGLGDMNFGLELFVLSVYYYF